MRELPAGSTGSATDPRVDDARAALAARGLTLRDLLDEHARGSSRQRTAEHGLAPHAPCRRPRPPSLEPSGELRTPQRTSLDGRWRALRRVPGRDEESAHTIRRGARAHAAVSAVISGVPARRAPRYALFGMTRPRLLRRPEDPQRAPRGPELGRNLLRGRPTAPIRRSSGGFRLEEMLPAGPCAAIRNRTSGASRAAPRIVSSPWSGNQLSIEQTVERVAPAASPA